MKVITALIASLILAGNLQSALNYTQEFFIGNCSQEILKESVRLFCEEAKNDPNIEVMKITYSEDSPLYKATFLCKVSKPDDDVQRVNFKSFQRFVKENP